MACFMSNEAKEQKRVNLEIDKRLMKDKRVILQALRILLLGMV